MNEELLKVLIDKTVDMDAEINKTQEMIRKLDLEPATAELGQRMGVLEQNLTEIKDAVGRRTGELQIQVSSVATEVATVNRLLGQPGGWLLNAIQDLGTNLEKFTDFFSKPSKKEVHHRHFLGWPVIVVIALVFVAALEWMELSRVKAQVELHAGNDLLWRAAKLADDSVVTKALDGLTRQYNTDAGQFEKDLLAEEERRTELFEQQQRKDAAAGRIEQLKKDKKDLGR